MKFGILNSSKDPSYLINIILDIDKIVEVLVKKYNLPKTKIIFINQTLSNSYFFDKFENKLYSEENILKQTKLKENKKYEIFYQIDESLCFHFYKNEIFFINLGFAELVEKYHQKEKALAMEKSRKAKEFLMPLEDIRGVFVRNKEKKLKNQNFSQKNTKNRRFY